MEIEFRELPPMVVASALGFGAEPEPEAWGHILGFAEKNGLDVASGRHRFFGFNNPNPTAGSPNYGYEQWMTVKGDVQVEPPVTLKEIPGSRYAVTRFKGLEHITETWRDFVRWFEESGLQPGPNCEQCLEELLNPTTLPPDEWEFDLYLPVADSN
jgi:effector-binding domain-containing protein